MYPEGFNLCLPRVILHSERRVLQRDDQREEGLTPICTDGTDFWIAVVLLLLFAGRVCAVSLEEAVGLFFGEFFFVVILLFVFFVVEVIEVVGIKGGAGFGEIEAFGGGCGADGVGGVGFGVEAAGVVGGELEAVEESGGSLDVELSGGESVDDEREGDLDGFAVLEWGELDVLAGDEVAAGGLGGAEGGVAAGGGDGGSSTNVRP